MSHAIQGHPYLLGETKVLALESGPLVWVGIIRDGLPWFEARCQVPADMLEPMGLRYLGGAHAE